MHKPKVLKNKKGSTMVEAALILPLVILAVISVIYILIFLYSETAMQSKMHIALRAQMGRETETSCTYRNLDKHALIYEASSGLADYYCAEDEFTFAGGGLLAGGFVKTLAARVHEVNEKKYMRKADLLKL